MLQSQPQRGSEAGAGDEVSLVLGVAVGFGLGNVITAFTDFAVNIPWDWALRGALFCTVVGLVFGMWPAIRASRLAPIEALRYE